MHQPPKHRQNHAHQEDRGNGGSRGGGIGDTKNGYLSDDESDASQDGSPRNLWEPALPTEDNFYNLIGPPTFKHWI